MLVTGLILACAPLANDYVLASVRYAEAVDESLSESAQLEQLALLAKDYPWFTLARWTIAEFEQKRQNYTAAYTAFKRIPVGELPAADQATRSQHLAELQARSPALALYASAESAEAAKDYDKAQRLARQVLESKANFDLAWTLLARAFLATDQCDTTAFEKYEQSLPAGPERARVRAAIDACEARIRAGALISPWEDEPVRSKKKERRK